MKKERNFQAKIQKALGQTCNHPSQYKDFTYVNLDIKNGHFVLLLHVNALKIPKYLICNV